MCFSRESFQSIAYMKHYHSVEKVTDFINISVIMDPKLDFKNHINAYANMERAALVII